MKFIHTADWHLGRLFHGIHLTEDQAHILDQVLDLVRDTRPDAFIIAGDVYDRAVPPPEAVKLLDDGPLVDMRIRMRSAFEKMRLGLCGRHLPVFHQPP